MNRDKRLDSIKVMIEAGHITEFKQIFHYIPKSLIGKHLRTNNPRMSRLVLRVDELTVQEIISISTLFNVDYTKLTGIVFKQYFNDHKRRSKE
jgi:hypothetical protein